MLAIGAVFALSSSASYLSLRSVVNNLRHFYGIDTVYIGHVVGPGGHCTCHYVFGFLKMALMELLLNFSGDCLRSVFLKCY